jgi:3-dehydroquinate synthase
MPTVCVALGERSYDVVVENGLLERAGTAMVAAGIGPCRVAVVSDETVAKLHGTRLVKALEAEQFSVTLHTVPAGEASKSLHHLEEVCRGMIRTGHDRRSVVVALGGGVIGDLAGFVAAVFYRGVPFVQIPTTVVAQVDSSVGGKTGVNVPEGKNLLGAFHQPRLVLVDPETLHTLPRREFCEGLAEAIKHAAIRDAAMLDDLAELDPDTSAIPAELVARNIAIKARVVEADEYETLGIRALLNFGHTIGHGIEAAVPYGEMLHGEAIALGMRAALFLSERHAGLPAADSAKVLDLLERFALPLTLPAAISAERIMEKLARDKKFAAGQIRFVLLSRPGHAQVCDSLSATDLREAIDHLRTMNQPTVHPDAKPIAYKVFPNADIACAKLAAEVAELIRTKTAAGQQTVLGLATGNSPLPFYRELVRLHRQEGLSFANVVTFNLDEYLGLGSDNPQSYRAFMAEHLFNHIDAAPENLHVPDGLVAPEELEAYCAAYEAAIDAAGGLDFQLLGIGRTGHIGFNEPGSGADSATRRVTLDLRTRQDAANAFGGLEKVPTEAITMGCGTILNARKIALLAWGKNKAEIVRRAMLGPVVDDVPASLLQHHGNTTFYLDEEAATEIPPTAALSSVR